MTPTDEKINPGSDVVTVKVPKKRSWLVRFCLHPVGKALLILIIVLNLAGFGTFYYFYNKYSELIDKKLAAGAFATTSTLYSAPSSLVVGEQISRDEIVVQLRRSGYNENKSPMGWYHLRDDGGIDIFPGPASYFSDEPGMVKFQDGKVSKIVELRGNTNISQYYLEPELITNLFDRNREKRRLVHFNEIPKLLVNAVVSAEDKRFFQHAGFDPLRIGKGLLVDLREGRKAQGASTLSMQLARGLWLDTGKRWTRKAAESLITIHLEQKLSKEQIFEYYSNYVPLGQRGSFAIHGFGEASQTFFGKDLGQITLPEAALLAGLIQRPSYTNPYKWPDRARNRRNIVLWLMLENGYITDREYNEAKDAPIKLTSANAESTDAPFFVDLVNDTLASQFQDYDFHNESYRVYTSLDMNLQREAAEAVRLGMKEVDEQIRKRTKAGNPVPEAQVTLIALDPHTGEVKALVGGRDYGQSQLDHAVAKRPPGSVFKPFVYAAALNTAVAGGASTFTPASTVVDEATTFYYDGRPYVPNNFHNEFHGTVTLRTALAKSLNIPTVKVAEAVGYRNVVDLARRAGMNMDIRPTPAVALGSYDVTPLEIAGSYTVFANNGVYVKPTFLRLIRDRRNGEIYTNQPERRPVLDPRVNFLMVDLMEEVMRSGTAAGVRSRGFTVPAAGKTGTSHDGWFAGFTSKLLCVVWVGFDNYDELKLEGAKSALPIWTEFMKRSLRYREYRNVQAFDAPDGIVSVDVDPLSGQLATATCPNPRAEMFISGTQPQEMCKLHGGGGIQVTGWEQVNPPAGGAQPVDTPGTRPSLSAVPSAPGGTVTPRREPARTAENVPTVVPTTEADQPPQKKRGIFGRIRDIFK